jgi:ABC-type multidrug transport system permease subunit
MKLFKLIQKNLKLLLRSFGSIITTIIGPLLVIIIVGLAFSNMSGYKITIGVYSPSYNDLTNSFIHKLETQNFDIIKYSYQDNCILDIKKGTVHSCIYFPDDFEIASGNRSQIDFYVDESNTNVVELVKDAISKQVSQRSKELSEDLTSNVLGKIDLFTESSQDQLNLVDEMIDSTASAGSNLKSANSNLNSMDLDFNVNSLDIDVFESKTSDVKTKINAVNNTGVDIIETTESLISDITSLSLGNSQLDSLLSQATTDINGLKDDFNSDSKTAKEKIEELTQKIESLSEGITEISKLLNTADSVKLDVDNKLSSTKNTINMLESDLLNLKTQISDLSGNMNDLEVTDASGIVAPITTEIKPVVSDRSPLEYMLPGLLVLVVMFTSMLLSGTLVVIEKKSSAYFRNFVTPTKDLTFLFGIFITALIVVFVQMVVVLSASYFIFGIDGIMNNLGPTLLIIVFSISLYSLIGMIMGDIFNSQEMTGIGIVGISSLFLLLSNFIFPLEKMPDYIVSLAKYNPFFLTESLLRKAIIFETSGMDLLVDLGFVFGIILCLFIMLISVHQIIKYLFFFKGFHYKNTKEYSNLDKGELKKLNNKNSKCIESDLDDMISAPESDSKKEKKSKDVNDNKKINSINISSKVKLNDNSIARKLDSIEYFILSNGQIIKSFNELVYSLLNMDDLIFSSHVNKSKNDFYYWIKDVLNDEKVAKSILKVKNKKKMYKILKKNIK